MDLGLSRRVHVAAVGYYLDRVWEIPLRANADRLWLIVDSRGDRSPEGRYVRAIERHLSRAAPRMEVRKKYARLWDFQDTLAAYVQVIVSEMRESSDVWVNVSTGSKLQGVAAALASMSHGAHLYYVVAESFQNPPPTPRGATGPRPIAAGVQAVVHLPTYRLDRPLEEDLRILRALEAQGGVEVRKKDLVQSLLSGVWEREPLTRASTRTPEARLQSGFVRLNRSLTRLSRSPAKVLQRGSERRRRVSLTEEGRMTLLLSGPT